MALIDKASLLMVPSTYEAGKLYNVLPSGNRAPDSTDQNSGYDQTRADFDFDRGSNAAATRIGSDGLIKKYRENVLTESNNFSDSDWTLRAGASVTSGQSGYDGTNNAWLLNADTAGTFRFINQATNVNTILTNSIYAKAGSVNYIGVTDASGSSGNIVYFDLLNGTIDSVTGGSLIIDYKIQSVGNGWYRCSAALTAHSSGTVLWYVSSTGGSVGSAGDNIYIQNAQTESSLVATEYLNSTDVTAKAGVLVDLPRINYDANGNNGALLLEPSRQQLITQSEAITFNTTNVGYTASENDTTSPEGVVNGGKILEASGTTHLVQKTFSVSSTTTSYAVSFFIKGIGRTKGNIVYGLDGAPYNSVSASFNLAEETITDAAADGTGAVAGETDIIPMGNDWYRVTLAGVIGVTGTHYVRLFGQNDSGNTSYNGEGTKGFNVYGFQAEAAATYATSYIPTMGTAQTRAADSCSVTGASDVIGQTEGTVFAEYDFDATIDNSGGSDRDIIALNDGTFNNNIQLIHYGNGSGSAYKSVYLSVRVGGNYVVTIASSQYSSGLMKIAAGYANNDYVLYVNGVQIGTDTNAGVAAMSKVTIGKTATLTTTEVKQATLFKERLTNAELATLTTL